MAPPQRQVAVGWASFLLGFNTFMQPADALGMGCPMSDRLINSAVGETYNGVET